MKRGERKERKNLIFTCTWCNENQEGRHQSIERHEHSSLTGCLEPHQDMCRATISAQTSTSLWQSLFSGKDSHVGGKGIGVENLLLDRYVPWWRWITVEAHKRRWEKERLRLLQRNAWRRSADLWTLGNRRLFLWIESHHCLMPPIHQDNPRPRKLERRDTEGGRKKKKVCPYTRSPRVLWRRAAVTTTVS